MVTSRLNGYVPTKTKYTFGHTHFMVNVHAKMKVVENFYQLSNVMYKNMGLLT